MNFTKICNKIIEYSFYALFFFVPLVFSSDTSELFELNKIWLTFVLAIIIGAAWFAKMIIKGEFRIQRTPLDLPILLFLFSQAISTALSLDTHVSLWGYYSRFNGGLFSIMAYIFLYYAFVSNFTKEMVKKTLLVSLASGLVVTLWGLPSHFGYDPTCLLFRGSLDVSCWTEAFQPKVRIFSTLGQPNWLAAYLSILLPISIALFLKNFAPQITTDKKYQIFSLNTLYIILTTLFYLAILFTGSRSGFAGLLAAGLVFFVLARKSYRLLLPVIGITIIISLFLGTPLSPSITQLASKFLPKLSQITKDQRPTTALQGPALETGGTESGKIRLIVWKGALDIWRHNPLFGTGVETFAFAYYKYRPAAHNLTSEWDYLYNKAHNEFLNYLATTGIFGLGSYLLMIGGVLFLSLKKLKTIIQSPLLILALISGYTSILVSNFLGFSVVILNIYLFLIPAFVFILADMIDPQKELRVTNSIPQWIGVSCIILTSLFMLLTLFRFWTADKSYSKGYNFDRAGEYQYAYLNLAEAVSLRTTEPVFQDELSYNSAVLAAALASQEASESAQIASYSAKLLETAIALSDNVVERHPNNIVFWKTRVRLFYALSQTDPVYLESALDSIKKASVLAPTDAKVFYSLGVLYGQTGDTKNAIEALQKTTTLKPDYRDAYYALALFYRDSATDKNGRVIDSELEKKAADTMRYILTFSPNDPQATQSLKSWGEM